MTSSDPLIAIAADSPSTSANAKLLAQELGLPNCSDPTCNKYHYVLRYVIDSSSIRLELHTTDKHAPGPVFVNFEKGSVGFRIRHGGRRKEPLARAIGLKGTTLPTVLDATSGLGRDAFILASLGCQVRLIERSPVIASLLRDGLIRAEAIDKLREVTERMQLNVGDAVTIMSQLSDKDRPDVIYLDPMYPHRLKSALVKKEMRLLRALVGDDLDAPRLLSAALHTARKRVVVKRPRYAATLPGIEPSHVLFGSTTRYDVYMCTGANGE